MEKKNTGEQNKTEMNGKTQLIIVFLIGFLLGLLVGPTFMGDKATSDNVKVEEGAEKDGENSDTLDSQKGTGKVSASNQIAGDRVIIDSVSTSVESWIVIREVLNGAQANALGARRISAGDYTNEHVDLLRNTQLGQTYIAVLHKDNGDGEFDLSLDTPIMDSNDKAISSSFEIIQVDRRN